MSVPGMVDEKARMADRTRLLLLVCICFALMGRGAAYATMSCGECVILVDYVNYYCVGDAIEFNVPTWVHGVDHSCTVLSAGGSMPGGHNCFYRHSVMKLSFSSGYWNPRGQMSYNSISADIGADFVFDPSGGGDYGDFLTSVYKHNCANLPTQQPTSTPSSDTGKPECGEQLIFMD